MMGRVHWAMWGLFVLAAIIVCMGIVDRPLAEFAAAHRLHIRAIQFLIGIPGLLLAVALIVSVLGWALRLSWPTWRKVLLPCSKSIIWTGAAVELVLKRVFGRPGPISWLNHHDFAFHWFRGRTAEFQSMPSGEAAMLGATIGVLWVTLPRWRRVYLAIGGLEALGLVWFQWHFASDIIAGAAIGIVGAAMALRT